MESTACSSFAIVGRTVDTADSSKADKKSVQFIAPNTNQKRWSLTIPEPVDLELGDGEDSVFVEEDITMGGEASWEL